MSAEQVRDGVFKCLAGDCSCKSHESEEAIVLKALESYANAKVEEEREKPIYGPSVLETLRDVRNKTLDQAAEILMQESHDSGDFPHVLAERIISLKSKEPS